MFRRCLVISNRFCFSRKTSTLARALTRYTHTPTWPTKHRQLTIAIISAESRSRICPYALSPLALLLLLAACATPPQVSPLMESPAIAQQIAAEPVGDYYIGRRVYAPPFAIWGYVRSPRQSWKTAKLVILNEKLQFAPDRIRNQIGSDNGTEYRLYGYFSGDQIYDASSGRFCAEFVLKHADLISSDPPPIWSAYFIRDRQMFEGWPRGGSQPTSQ
jgi:hypothetical protein